MVYAQEPLAALDAAAHLVAGKLPRVEIAVDLRGDHRARRYSTALAHSGLSRAKCVIRWLALMAKVNGSGTCSAHPRSTSSLAMRW